MEEFLFATSNTNKYKEAQAIFGHPLRQIVIELDEIQAAEPRDVIKHKAKQAYELLGKPVIVEDVGLHFEWWNGLPGALIKWFLEHMGKEGILDATKHITNRKVKAVCCVGLFDGTEYVIYEGIVSWSLAESIEGETQFGRDPLFIPEGETKSYAQMSPEEKNKISHRHKAREQLEKHFSS